MLELVSPCVFNINDDLGEPQECDITRESIVTRKVVVLKEESEVGLTAM